MGYTVRGQRAIRVPTTAEITGALDSLGLSAKYLVSPPGKLTKTGRLVTDYFKFRADVLNMYVEPRLMDSDRAKLVFEQLHAKLSPRCPLPINKQKGAKQAPAFLTAIVNMLVEANSREHPCDFDPHQLTTITRNSLPLRTLSRRIDGAFPSAVNPVAVWEIKEYYYTTTFGSRVADGVYETLLDGMELEELRACEKPDTGGEK